MHFGCAKNLVDTELMAGKLISSGYEISLNPQDDDLYAILINTCSFIQDAEKESVYTMYYDYREPLKTIPTHRTLAINRGENEEFLKVSIEVDKEKALA